MDVHAVGLVREAFSLPEEEWMARYGRCKPQCADDVIVHCRSGVRSEKAYVHLCELGFRCAGVFGPGWSTVLLPSASERVYCVRP